MSTASGSYCYYGTGPTWQRQLTQSATDASREQFAAMLGHVSRLLTIEGASGGKTAQLSVISADGEDAPLGEPDLRGGAVQSCAAAAAYLRRCSSQMLQHFSRPGPRRSECGYVSSALNRCLSFSRSRSTQADTPPSPGSGRAAPVSPVAPSPRRAHWQRAASWTCAWSPSKIGPTRPPGEAPCLQVLVVLPSR